MGGMEFGKPRGVTEEEVEDLIRRWGEGAEVLFKAGADGAQLREWSWSWSWLMSNYTDALRDWLELRWGRLRTRLPSLSIPVLSSQPPHGSVGRPFGEQVEDIV